MTTTPPPTAALLVIGNEILSGKVRDENTHFLATRLFALGWDLKEVAVVGDVESEIVKALQRFHRLYDHVFTSGGVGPTHDDITVTSVARALGRTMVFSPVLERVVKSYFKTDILSPSQHRLTMIPEGSTMHYGADSIYPQMVVDRIYPLPGIPALFRKKFEELTSLWPPAPPRGRRCFNLVALETDLATLLGELADEHPEVNIGSYPTEVNSVWHLELVLESRSLSELDSASDKLGRLLTTLDYSWDERSWQSD